MTALKSEETRFVAGWQRYVRRLIAREISTMSRYYDRVIQVAPTAHEDGQLLQYIDAPKKLLVPEGQEFPDLTGERDERSIVLLNGVLNHHYDIEQLLTAVQEKLSRSSRVVIVAYNPYQRPLHSIACRAGLRSAPVPSTFITLTQLRNIAKLSGLQIVRIRPTVYFPARIGGVGSWLNRAASLVPGIRGAGSAWVIVLRKVRVDPIRPSLSVVVPARDERGNIEPALRRLRYLNQRIEMEVIFVEGHSTDGTWEEILRVREAYASEYRISAYRQTGVGKSDAVRLGFSKARHSLLTILDADLTMPPELLHRFYDAYCSGLGDFINGDRLTYPMEGEAMRPLNHLGNIFFAKALSHLLDTPLGDSLCGTKLLSASDYRRILAWRKDFGDFDPFGDFELLFPAAVLALGIVDVPVRYRDRQYGSTSIDRFRHGSMLLKMTAIGLSRIKAGQV
jgi:hypothetical protein